MKKIVLNHLCVCSIALLFNINVSAQQAAVTFAASGSSLTVSKLYDAPDNTNTATPMSLYDINIRAMRDFMKSFKQAENVEWYKTSEGAMAYFLDNGIKTRASYDNKGNWLYNMRSYAENNLPKEIRAQVKSIYYDFLNTCFY